MDQSVEAFLEQLRRRVRQVLWLRGLSWLAFVLLSLFGLVCAVDGIVHLQSAVLRAGAAVGVLLAGLFVAWRFLLVPLRVPLSDIGLAMLLERNDPALRDGLVSAVQFRACGFAARLGSSVLQREVADRASQSFVPPRVSDLLDTRTTLRVTAAAVCVMAAWIAVIGQNPTKAATAVRRFMLPFSVPSWPRRESVVGVPVPPVPELRNDVDRVPSVLLEEPSGDLQVTPKANVRLRITAQDDRGIEAIRLRIWVVMAADLRSVSGGTTYEPQTDGIVLPLHSSGNTPQRQLVIDYDLDLNSHSISELIFPTDAWGASAASPQPPATVTPTGTGPVERHASPGCRIVLQAEATDTGNSGPTHVGRSSRRILTVVTVAEKTAEFAELQVALLQKLVRLREAQTLNQEKTRALAATVESSGSPGPNDVAQLRTQRNDQRRIAAEITNNDQGVGGSVIGLGQDLKNSRIEDPLLERRLDSLKSELNELQDRFLPDVDDAYANAMKQLADKRVTKETTGPALSALPQIANRQNAVLAAIERMHAVLAGWHNRNDLLREVQQLVAGQQSIYAVTSKLAQQTATRTADELTPVILTELASLADRQRQHAMSFEQFVTHLSQAVLADREERVARRGSLAQAADYVKEQTLSGQMRDAADSVKQNRIGQALTLQHTVLTELEAVKQLLENPAISNSNVSAGEPIDLKKKLSGLADRQQELIDQTTQLERQRQERGHWSRSQLKSLLAVTAGQRDLRQETEQLAGILEPMDDWRKRLVGSAESMETAAERLSQRLTNQATRDAQEDARDRLVAAASVVTLRHDDRHRSQADKSTETAQNRIAVDIEGATRSPERRATGKLEGRSPKSGDESRIDSGEAAQDSTHSQSRVSPAISDAIQRPFLETGVWGHLPPSIREKLTNVSTDQMLPQYRDLIRRYYESLAESDSDNRRAPPIPKSRDVR